MKKIIFSILLIASGSFNILAQANVTAEEYAVYAKVFEHVFGFNYKPESKPHFVILEDTSSSKTDFNPAYIPPGNYSYHSLEYFLQGESDYDNLYKINPQKGMTPQKLEEILRDFKEKKRFPAKLERKFSIKQEYSLISQSALEKLLAEGKKIFEDLPNKEPYLLLSGGIIWKRFREKYPSSNGCYILSRVGFSRDKNFAMVFVHRENGDDATYGYYIFEKVADEWANPKMFGYGRSD